VNASNEAAAGAARQVEQLERQIEDSQAQTIDLAQETRDLRAKVNQLLFTCDCYLQNEASARAEATGALNRNTQLEQELEEARQRTDDEIRENSELRGKINELLFTCDCYLQRVNDLSHCSQVLRRARFRRMLNGSKAVARKIPVVRTILRPIYDRSKRVIKRSRFYKAPA